MINEEVRHIIEPELIEGEELLWADKPSHGYEFKKVYFKIFRNVSGIFTLSVAVLSLVFSVGGGVLSVIGLTNLESKQEAYGMIFGGFIMSVISVLCFFLFWRVCDFALKITESVEYEAYAITQNRGIIISPYFKERIRILSLSDLKKHKVIGKNIGRLSFPPDRQISLSAIFYNNLFNFHNIKNPKDVSKVIRQNLKDLP